MFLTSYVLPLSQLHGRSESASESSWFPHEEGAGLLRHGPGETSEAFPGHPGRVRAVQLRSMKSEGVAGGLDVSGNAT